VIDEHLTLKDMVEDRAAAGKRALGSWLGRCRREVGDVGVGTFKKLLNSLVKSIILYGAEIWGCVCSLDVVQQVQLRAFCLFFGVPCIPGYPCFVFGKGYVAIGI
jgi:hypothetical protein